MIVIILLLIYTFLAPNSIEHSVSISLTLFIKNVFPLLFLFLIYSDMIMQSGLSKQICNRLYPLFKRVFNIQSPASAYVICTAAFLGNPGTAKLVSELYNQKQISRSEANYLLSFTSYTSPIFTIAIVGKQILNSYYLGILLFLVSIISNVLIGIIFKQFYTLKRIDILTKKNSFKFFSTLKESIQKNIAVMLMIGGIMIFFGIVISFIDYFEILSFLPNILRTTIYGIIEITNGLFLLKDISLANKTIICAFLLGFGGLSLHFQVYNFIEKKLSYAAFLRGRIVHAIINFILMSFFIRILA